MGQELPAWALHHRLGGAVWIPTEALHACTWYGYDAHERGSNDNILGLDVPYLAAFTYFRDPSFISEISDPDERRIFVFDHANDAACLARRDKLREDMQSHQYCQCVSIPPRLCVLCSCVVTSISAATHDMAELCWCHYTLQMPALHVSLRRKRQRRQTSHVRSPGMMLCSSQRVRLPSHVCDAASSAPSPEIRGNGA